MKIVMKLFGAALVYFLSLWVIYLMFGKQFKADCYKWKEYESAYPAFELNASLVKQCANEGISIK